MESSKVALAVVTISNDFVLGRLRSGIIKKLYSYTELVCFKKTGRLGSNSLENMPLFCCFFAAKWNSVDEYVF